MIFYEMSLRRSGSMKGAFAWFDFMEGEVLVDPPSCPDCGTPLGPRPVLPPFRIRLEGNNLGDLCSSGYGSQFLLSRHLLDGWERSGLTGLEVHPDGPIFQSRASHSGVSYSMVKPVNTLTSLDETESGLVVHALVGCRTCGVAQRSAVDRIRIRMETWDGSDIFFPSGLFGILLVSENFVRFVQEGMYSNFLFLHQDDFRERRSFS